MLGSLVCRLGDRLLGPVNRAAGRRRVGPSAVNAMELTAAGAAGVCFALQLRWPAIGLLALHGGFDYLEGGIRRARGSGAAAGSAWRHATVDKVSDVLLLAAMAWGGFVWWWLALPAAFSAVAVTGLGLWLRRRAPRLRARTLFDRADRLVLLLLATAAGRIPWGICLLLAMNVLTIAHRVGLLWTRARKAPATPAPRRPSG